MGPARDADPLLGADVLVDCEQQLLLAVVLNELAHRQPAAERNLVELGFRVHASRDGTCGQSHDCDQTD